MTDDFDGDGVDDEPEANEPEATAAPEAPAPSERTSYKFGVTLEGRSAQVRLSDVSAFGIKDAESSEPGVSISWNVDPANPEGAVVTISSLRPDISTDITLTL